MAAISGTMHIQKDQKNPQVCRGTKKRRLREIVNHSHQQKDEFKDRPVEMESFFCTCISDIEREQQKKQCKPDKARRGSKSPSKTAQQSTRVPIAVAENAPPPGPISK